jgi:hypothetical protein
VEAAARLPESGAQSIRVGDQRLRLAARVDDAGELEELPEPDRVVPDLDLARGP